MAKKFLTSFSYIFHPIFIPVYATLFYLFLNQSYIINTEKDIILLQVTIVTIVIPILFFLLLRFTGRISSMMAPVLSERKMPLVIQCFLLIILIRKSITIDRYTELHFFLLGALVSTLLALLLLFVKTKASLHMAGVSGLTVFIFGLSILHQIPNMLLIVFMVLMNGFVASSRLIMKAHTLKELIIGILLGSIPQMLFLYLWL